MLLARIYYKNKKIIVASGTMSMIKGKNRLRDNDPKLKSFSLTAASINRELFLMHKERKNSKKRYNSSRPVSWGNNISKSKKGKPYGTSVKDATGKIFRTLKECADEYGVSPETIKFWATRYKDIKGFSLIESKEKLSTSGRSKKVMSPSGKIYDSITKCAEDELIERHRISNWIKNHPEKGYKFI